MACGTHVIISSIKFVRSNFFGFGGSSLGLHLSINDGKVFGGGLNNNGLGLGGVEDSGAASLAFVKGLLDLGVGVSGLVPLVLGGEVTGDLL